MKNAFRCPHLKTKCTKRSQHRDIGDLPFGVCSVWHRPDFTDHPVPHIICPHRLGTDHALAEALSFVKSGAEKRLLKGIKMKTLGTLDYVVVSSDTARENILDFAGVEIMAMSTTNTGKIIRAMLDGLEGKLGETYNYGINYRQVLSRMVVQLCAKGTAFSMWGKKTIWVIQDVLYEYMQEVYDLRLSADVRDADPIILLIYKLVDKGDRFDLELSARRSGQPRHFSDLLYTIDVPTKDDAEAILLKKINGKD
ncbi:MAG: NotI family restriction endonuclease [Planctomycetota bacterium]